METGKSRVYVAINMTKVVAGERALQLMQSVGPKVCMLTASNPGFLGYQANLQTGILPMAGRYGGASLHMERELNPVRLYQYTMWRDPESHLAFHRAHFARLFELCVSCLSVVVDGPWEPVYEIVGSQMPVFDSLLQIVRASQERQARPELAILAPAQRNVALTEYTTKAGQERPFEQGISETMNALSASPGFLGYMLMRQVSVNPLGSFMLDPESMMQMLETLGANPPAAPKPLFDSRQAKPNPAEYLLHTEWETPELAEQGLDKVLVNHSIRELYSQQVMPNLIRGPYTVLFRPMMEEPSWRRSLA